LLLFLGAGALTLMPATGWFISRTGTRKVILLSAFVIAATLPLLLVMNSPVPAGIMLFVFGAGIGSIDVAMNAHAVQVQHVSGKPMMSSFHGLFSVGGLFGALGIGLLIKAGLSPVAAAVCVSALLALIGLNQYGRLFNAETERAVIARFSETSASENYSRLSWLNGRVLFLGAMCFAVFLSEGAVLDWGAIFLRDHNGLDEALSGVGYAAFSIAMAFMRLTGDRIISKFSSRRVVIAGSLAAAAGFLLIVVTSWLPLSLLGFIFIGLGAANIVPVFFSEGGRIKNVASTTAIPAITTMGYAGQLAGPALLGLVADQWSLQIAFVATGLLLLIVAIAYGLRKNDAL